MRNLLWFSGNALILGSVIRLAEDVSLNSSPWNAAPLFLLGMTALFISSAEPAS